MDCTQLNQTASHWDQLACENCKRDFTRKSWGGIRQVALNHNYLITGDPNYYWIDYLRDKYFPGGYAGHTLSLGCGEGFIERLMKDRGFKFASITGIDLSPRSIEVAKKKAEELYLAPEINYLVMDLNHFTPLGNSYDFIFFFHSLHHISELENILRGCRHALRPNGIIMVNEYVGPSRFQWTDQQLTEANAIFRLLPPELRFDLSSQTLRKEIPRETIENMMRHDPSEAVRSDDIERILKDEFIVIEEKNWGGTLNHLIFENTAGNYEPGNPCHDAIASLLIHHENSMIDNSLLPSDYKFFVARPRSDVMGIQYWDSQKTERIECNWPMPRGELNYIEFEPEGILRLVGWSENLGVFEDKDCIALYIGGEVRKPESIYRLMRNDLPRHLAMCGVMFEFIGGFELGQRISLNIEGNVYDVATSDSLCRRVAPYKELLFSPLVAKRDGIYGSGPPVTEVSPDVLQLSSMLMDPILDFGCGSGALISKMRGMGRHVQGVELNTRLLQDNALAESKPWITYYEGNLPLPFESNAFASIIAAEVIERVKDYRETLEEIHRIAGHSFLMTVPDMAAIPILHKHNVVPWHLLEATHVNFFTYESLKAELSRLWPKENIVIYRFGHFNVNGTIVSGHLAAYCEKN